MKKNTVFALLGAACLLLTACGKDDSSSAGNSSSAAETTSTAALNEARDAEKEDETDTTDSTTTEIVTQTTADTDTTAAIQTEVHTKPAGGGSSAVFPADAFTGSAAPEDTVKRAMDAYIAADASAMFACMPQCFADALGTELTAVGMKDMQEEFDEDMAAKESAYEDHVFSYEIMEFLTFAQADALLDTDDTFEYARYDDAEEAEESVCEMLETWNYHGEKPEYGVVRVLIDYPDEDEKWNMGITVFKLGDRWYDTLSGDFVHNHMEDYTDYPDVEDDYDD